MVFCLVQLSSDEAIYPLSYQNLPQLLRPVQLRAELASANEGLARLWRGVSLRRKQRLSKSNLKIQFLLRACNVVGRTQKSFKAFSELRNRLGHHPPCERLPASLEPVADRLLLQARFHTMTRQELGLRCHNLRKL